jgi:hypothetical protein
LCLQLAGKPAPGWVSQAVNLVSQQHGKAGAVRPFTPCRWTRVLLARLAVPTAINCSSLRRQ